MPIAIDPAKTWEYILKADRGRDNPTRFTLAALTVADEAELQDALVKVDGATKLTTVASGTHTLQVLRLGLVGWSDFLFADGRRAEFKANSGLRKRGRAMVDDECLNYLSPADRKELAEAIIERNTLSEDERKNFSSALAS